ncbi:MAG: hypothetical protein F7C34_01035 [Desulfurococcales archaeon]|nr:hypothetical protein [Desulfurococcales archaeon]
MGGCDVKLIEEVEINGRIRYRIRVSKNGIIINFNIGTTRAEDAVRRAIEIASKYLGPC